MPAFLTYPSLFHIKDLFSLQISHRLNQTKIEMKMLNSIVRTDQLPLTESILEKNLPQVLSSTCFNDQNIPFAVEVRDTEVGHLFEHILLEYLCSAKLATGCDEAEFSGWTDWNWVKETVGTYHITIDIDPTEIIFFPPSLQKTISLVTQIFKDDSFDDTSLFMPLVASASSAPSLRPFVAETYISPKQSSAE